MIPDYNLLQFHPLLGFCVLQNQVSYLRKHPSLSEVCTDSVSLQCQFLVPLLMFRVLVHKRTILSPVLYQEMLKDLYASSVLLTLTLCSTPQLSLLLPPGDSDYEVPKLVVTDMHLYEWKHKQSVHLHLHIFQTFLFEFRLFHKPL